MDYLHLCGSCRKKHKEKKEDPPCYIGNEKTNGIPCRIDPRPENVNAIKIFSEVKFQLIMGPGGPIDLNHLAIEAAINRKNIVDPACFDKVVALGRWWITERLSKRD